jgi:Mn-dependent DtxR family transcriptional regulator
LKGRPTLGKYLRGTGSFRRQDLEEVLNVSREEANAIINTLWEARMVRKDKGDVRVEPTLHALLREVKW